MMGCCVTMLSTSMLTTAGELLFTIDTSGFLTSPAAGREATASPAGFVSLTTPDSLSVYLVAIYEPAVPRAGRAAREKDQRRQGRRRDFFEFFQTETPPKISLYSFALHVGYNSIRSTKVNKNYRGLFVKSQSRARSRFAVRISHAAPTIIPAVQT